MKLQYLKGSKESAKGYGVDFDARMWTVLDRSSVLFGSTVSRETLKKHGVIKGADPRLQPQAAAELSPEGELRWQRAERAEVKAKADLTPEGELCWEVKRMASSLCRSLFNYDGFFQHQWMHITDYQKWGEDHEGCHGCCNCHQFALA